MLDIASVMNDLALNRPVFHSEKDFQLALGLYIRDAIPDVGVRMEYKPFPAEAMYLDIWLPDIGVAMELKYKTRKLDLLLEGESFALRDQRAQEWGRYDFLKDIERLERLRALPHARAGLAVLLTNDASYWDYPARHTTLDEAFRLHEGRTITGEMAWPERASSGAIKDREAPILLSGSYDLHWQDYADMEYGHHRQFRYLAVQTSFYRSVLEEQEVRKCYLGTAMNSNGTGGC